MSVPTVTEPVQNRVLHRKPVPNVAWNRTGGLYPAVHVWYGANVQTCPDCNGTGKIIKDKCPDCRGTGYTSKQKKIQVSIPAGIDNGRASVSVKKENRELTAVREETCW